MKRRSGVLFGTVIGVAGLFGISGTLAWWNAWLFFAVMMLIGGFTQRLINTSPGLAEERKTAAEKAKPWDLKLVRLINLALPAMLVAAALDVRFRWTFNVPAPVSIAAFFMMVLSAIFTFRAIAANHFFSSHVRIQQDRGQVVVSSGPYGIVRHPGYAGSIFFNLLAPLALGSWGTLLLGAGTAMLLVYRTAREDRVLMEELPGYAEYSTQVRYRLAPGMW